MIKAGLLLLLLRAETHEIPLSVDDAVSLALHENYDIRTATLQRVADRYAVYVAEDKFRPHVSANATIGATAAANIPITVQTAAGENISITPHAEILLPTGMLLSADLQENFLQPPAVGSSPANALFTFTASQPLVRDFGLAINRASVDIALLRERINRLILKNTIINSVANVIYAYRTFTQSRVLVNIARNAVQRSRDILDINHQMASAGRIAPAELIQVESEIATREVNQVNAENDFVAAQVALLQLLAMTTDTPIAPVTEPVVDTPIALATERDAARTLALANRPEYLMGLVSEDIAAKNLQVAENNRKWDVRAVLQYRRGTVSPNIVHAFAGPITGPEQSLFAGVTLNVPLVEVLLQQQVVNSEVALSIADVNIAALSNTIQLSVDAACRTLELRQRALGLARRARELAQKKVDNEREKLSAGRSSNFQVLRFQDDLVNAEIAELAATVAYLNTVTTLEVTLGTLLERWSVQVE